ncbi:MAG: polyribonucleotide nucleotidyltransferase [Candidatus Cyclobacteriaceae bacterium M2_1C_046]
MQQNIISKSLQLPDGREITIETGRLARQADGAVVVRMGNTMLLATVVSSKEAKEGVDFLPLSVDYQEKFAAAGKIPGGFIKREGRLSDYEILISRLVDRALRPNFPEDYHADTQVMISLISADEDALPDALAGFAASAALAVSDIPFDGPISEVRVAKVDADYIINPTKEQKSRATIDLIVAGNINDIVMVEGEMAEASEEDMLVALKHAQDAIKKQCELQKELEKEVGKTEKREYSHETHDEELRQDMRSKLEDKVYEVTRKRILNKSERSEAYSKIKEEYIESLGEGTDKDLNLVGVYFKQIRNEAARNITIEDKVRIDGRKLNEIRPIWSEVDYLPMAHGSAVFTRGETQALTTVTLGTKMDEQLIDGAVYSGSSKFILHYNFPGFSTGEVRPNRGPGRREVGHGNLAWRALKQVLPADDQNPYTIRVVSDILESNGSSSMATVCAGALALMDAGLPISKPVSGIAMGMISDSESGKYAILSDILGDEDHLGDMDFKVTGTRDGLTACQMDLKITGLSFDVLKEALMQAKEGRMHILNEMNKTLSEPRPDLKPNAPRSEIIYIEKEMIGAIIGPGGKVIQDIQAQSGATLVVDEVNNKGIVSIYAANEDQMRAAAKRVKQIVTVPELDETYDGIVKSIQPYGAFVEFLPGKEGLLHISEIKWERLESMEGLMHEGEEVKVKLVGIDKKTGKFRLSRKVLLPKPDSEK